MRRTKLSPAELAARRKTIYKAQAAAAEARKDRPANFWHGGVIYNLAKQQFQCVYDRYGGLAMDIYEDFIVWPDHRRPGPEKISDWCREVDEGTWDASDLVQEATKRRLEAFVRADGIATQRSLGKFVRTLMARLTTELQAEKPDMAVIGELKSLSGIFQSAANSSSFHLRENIANKREPGQAVQYNMGNVRIVTNRSPGRKRIRDPRLKQIAQPLEAEFADVSE